MDHKQPTASRKSRGRKPQGEFVWVKDGKTEYLAQAVEPLAVSPPPRPHEQPLPGPPHENPTEDDEDEEIEVRWTHNGVFEWVSRSSVRVLWQEQEASATSSASSSSLLPPPPQRRTSTRKTPTKTIHNNSNKAMTPPPSSVTKKRKAAAVDDQGNAASHPKVVGTDDEVVLKKKPKTMRRSHDADTLSLGWTMVSTLSTHAALVKNSFLVGCQEIYKELVGHPASSSSS